MRKLLKEIELAEGTIFPSKSYTSLVLEPAFDEAKHNFIDYMMQINSAHLIMLSEQNLVSPSEVKKIGYALSTIDQEVYRKSIYSGQFEDLFFQIENDLIEVAGDIAGNLHIARSRNDMGIAIYRMTLRKKILNLMNAMLQVQKSLHVFAEAHIDTIMIGYTHTQQAQPTTLAHYLKAMIDKMHRDFKRLQATYETVNKSSMGAAALTTSGFSISRERMKELLGFDSIIENSWDAVAGADYLLETASTVNVAALNFGRSIQDFLLWATQEFDVFRLSNPYVQVSSIMPQKRNPVSLEHTRALLSSVVGDANTVMTMIHNTPFGDIVDTEDDLQPYLWRAIDKLGSIYGLFNGVLLTMTINKEKLEKRAVKSFANVTELADTLVRIEGISFRQAHHIVSHAVKEVIAEGYEEVTDLSFSRLKDVGEKVLGRPLSISEELFDKSLDPKNFVEVRSLLGGPSPKTLLDSLKLSNQMLKDEENWVHDKEMKLNGIENELKNYNTLWSEVDV